MRVTPSRRLPQNLLATLLIFAATLFGTAVVGSTAQATVVSRIDVQGNQRVDGDTIRAYLLIRPGQNFGSREEDASLKALFDTGLFADVNLNVRGATLLVIVVENPIINEVAFEGNKKFKDEQLASVVQSAPRGVFTRAKVQVDVGRILELYRRTGRFQASVTPQTIQLANNRVNLVFVVTEGPKTGVSGVTFIGNHAFGDARLRGVIATQRSGIMSFIRGYDSYDPDRLSSDEEKLRKYYLDRGFADFQVVSSVAELDRARNSFFITFTMNEGPRYRFGAVNVDSTIAGVDPSVIMRQVVTREGHVFSSSDIDRSLERITLYLAGHGYPFAQASPRLDRDPDTLTIGVTYVVDEGARVYVERIDIRGNTRTRDYVIRREIDLAEGDAFNRVLIDRAERRLKLLNYFSSVTVTTEQGSVEDRVVVVVTVVEQQTGELSFGVGYSTSDGAVGDISLTEKNFLGRGYNLRLSVSGGSSSKAYEVGFTDPYFLGRRISAGVNVFRRVNDANSFRSYDFESTGGGIGFGFPITEDFSILTGYQIELQNISASATGCANGTISLSICQSVGDTLISSVNYSLVYNSLDNPKDPHDGFYVKFTQEFAGVGGDVAYLRTTGSGTYFHEILPDRNVIGLIKVQGGQIFGIGQNVRLLDSFFKGGETVRGFASAGFGPRDSKTGDALGGKSMQPGPLRCSSPSPFFRRSSDSRVRCSPMPARSSARMRLSARRQSS